MRNHAAATSFFCCAFYHRLLSLMPGGTMGIHDSMGETVLLLSLYLWCWLNLLGGREEVGMMLLPGLTPALP